MKIVLDTNVILDAAMDRPGAADALALMQAVIRDEALGIVTANTLTDIHFIVRKRAGETQARSVVASILEMFDVSPVDAEVCQQALLLPMGDYEDAVLASCAVRDGADCIVTGDKGFLSDAACPVLAVTPSAALAMLRNAEAP